MAVGLLTMLFGAFLVFAPGAGAAGESSGNATCSSLLGPEFTDVVEAKDDNLRNAPFPADGTFYTFTDNFTVSYKLDATGVTFKDTSEPIYAVYIKQGSANQDVSKGATFDGVHEGFVEYTEGQFSHISFCTGTPPDPCADNDDPTDFECNPCVEDDERPECDPCYGNEDPTDFECNPCVEDDEREECQEFECAGDEEWTDTNEDGIVQPEECTEVLDEGECADDEEWTDTNEDGIVQDEECEAPEETPPATCDEDEKWTDVNGDGVVQPTECTEVEDSSTPRPVIRPTPTATPTPAVLGAQNNRALAATGSGSDTLTTVGVALIMFGAVLSMGSRRKVRYLR